MITHGSTKSFAIPGERHDRIHADVKLTGLTRNWNDRVRTLQLGREAIGISDRSPPTSTGVAIQYCTLRPCADFDSPCGIRDGVTESFLECLRIGGTHQVSV